MKLRIAIRKKQFFISGSAESYEPFEKNEAVGFVHNLAKVIIENDFRIVNGFGWGIGSSVINGALESIYNNPIKFSESQLILKPFPQFETGEKPLKVLWEEYRQKMISQCGISFFVFGNKKGTESDIVEANGVIREFEISRENGNICIPIGMTGYATNTIYKMIASEPEKYYEHLDFFVPVINELADPKTTSEQAIKIIDKLLKQLKK